MNVCYACTLQNPYKSIFSNQRFCTSIDLQRQSFEYTLTFSLENRENETCITVFFFICSTWTIFNLIWLWEIYFGLEFSQALNNISNENKNHPIKMSLSLSLSSKLESNQHSLFQTKWQLMNKIISLWWLVLMNNWWVDELRKRIFNGTELSNVWNRQFGCLRWTIEQLDKKRNRLLNLHIMTKLWLLWICKNRFPKVHRNIAKKPIIS